MSDQINRLAGAYVAWELHIGGHYCQAASGEGSCAAGDEILRRLHTAYSSLDESARREVMASVREWDWEPEAPYAAE